MLLAISGLAARGQQPQRPPVRAGEGVGPAGPGGQRGAFPCTRIGRSGRSQAQFCQQPAVVLPALPPPLVRCRTCPTTADRSCATFRNAAGLGLLNHLAHQHGPWRCYKIWLMPQAWVSGRDVAGDGARGRRCTRNAGAERKANAVWYRGLRGRAAVHRAAGGATSVDRGIAECECKYRWHQRQGRGGQAALLPTKRRRLDGSRAPQVPSHVRRRLRQASGSAREGGNVAMDVQCMCRCRAAVGRGRAQSGACFGLVFCAWAAAKRPRPARMRARRFGSGPT